MKIVFFGSSSFAVASLEALIASRRNVACVVTQPDTSSGRGLLNSSTDIKACALKHNLRLYQPKGINSPEAVKFLQGLDADLFVVVSYGQILSSAVLAVPKIFSINVHASLLPRYRGAAPVNWAIINGDSYTGVTIIRMNERMDSGEIIAQKRVGIEDSDTAITLEDKLAVEGAALLLECLKDVETNDVKLLPQGEGRQACAPKLKKSDGLINWRLPAAQVLNLVRGTAGWPGAFTYYRGKLLKVFKARVGRPREQGAAGIAGQITGVSRKGIAVATSKDELVIEELQMEGGRRMSVEEFLAGHDISVGETLRLKK
jgi:methionyl-tRNA formyltransferase